MSDLVNRSLGSRERRILGVRFSVGTADEVVRLGMGRGLVVVPSAPVLVALTEDLATREALVDAEVAIADSGLMVLLWWLLTGERLRRVSGLEYLKVLLDRLALGEAETVLWVMPSETARAENLAWLNRVGYETAMEDCYVAPVYGAGKLEDPALLEWVRARRARQVMMALGGGVQERLGYYLRQNLAVGEVPAIHCTGAAIGFLSGNQVRIPDWADRFFLGWLFRCLSSPRRFLPRYWKAVQLVWLIVRYRDQLPPMKGGA